MSDFPFTEPAQLIEAFGLDPDDSAYERTTEFDDGSVGFSVQRPYPENIAYRPPVLADGEPDVVAIIHVIYDPDPGDGVVTKNHVPIVLKIGPFSRSVAKHGHDHFGDKAGMPHRPTPESVQESLKTPRPIDLIDRNEISYNHTVDSLFGSDGNVRTGEEALDFIFNLHCKTARRFAGFRFRALMKAKGWGTSAMWQLGEVLEAALRVFFGRVLEKDSLFRQAYGEMAKPAAVRQVDLQKLNLFGYEAAINTVITYSGIVVALAAAVTVWGAPDWLAHGVWQHPLVVACLGLFTLWVLDHAGPAVLMIFLRWSWRAHTRLLWQEIKVK